MSRSCFPRWTKPRRFRPVGRCRSGSSTSRTDRCERAASIVMRTSQPNPAATGKQARRAAGDSARWPDRGSRTSKPARTSIRARATRFARPKPPPSLFANAATLRSPPPSRSGASSPERSASQRSSAPGGAARSAADSAWPFPRRGSRKTIAPAASAASAVPSREPSSATITSASGNVRRRVATVVPMTCSSSRAGTRIVSGSSTGRLLGQRCDQRQPRLPCPSCRSRRSTRGRRARR